MAEFELQNHATGFANEVLNLLTQTNGSGA
jgi:hypothetical protein